MMKQLKKIAITGGTIGVMGAMLAGPTFAQTTITNPNTGNSATVVPSVAGSGLNPISQWIVLSSLFSPGNLYGGTQGAATVTGPNGNTAVVQPTATSGLNPISQWIVLSSLFSPGYLYGGGMAGY